VRLAGITALNRSPQALDSSLEVFSILILVEAGLPMLLLELQQLLLRALELAQLPAQDAAEIASRIVERSGLFEHRLTSSAQKARVLKRVLLVHDLAQRAELIAKSRAQRSCQVSSRLASSMHSTSSTEPRTLLGETPRAGQRAAAR
jgi:hypothetical protein